MRTSLGLILCALSVFGVAADECVSGMSDSPYFPPERAEFIEPHNDTTAYQVIIPQYRFNCYGKILEWNALTVYREGAEQFFSRIAYFQVWRPTGVGTYTRVGYDVISVSNIQPSYTSASPGDGLTFYNITSEAEDRSENDEVGEDNRPLYFQPGDIVGFFIRGRTLRWPLIVTHHNATKGDPESLAVDMFYTTTQIEPNSAGDNQVCEMSECAESVMKIASVIPHIHFTYEIVPSDDVPQQPSNESCYDSSLDLSDCPVPTICVSISSCKPVSSSLLTPPSVNSSPSADLDPPACPERRDSLSAVVVAVFGTLLVTIVTGVLVILLLVVLRRRYPQKEEGSFSNTNPIYSEPEFHNTDLQMSSNKAYACPTVSNEASSHCYLMKINEAYECPPVSNGNHNMAMSKNEAYVSSAVSGNEVSSHSYRMKINEAYECVSSPVTNGNHSMTVSQNEAHASSTASRNACALQNVPNSAYAATAAADDGGYAINQLHDEVKSPCEQDTQ